MTVNVSYIYFSRKRSRNGIWYIHLKSVRFVCSKFNYQLNLSCKVFCFPLWIFQNNCTAAKLGKQAHFFCIVPLLKLERHVSLKETSRFFTTKCTIQRVIKNILMNRKLSSLFASKLLLVAEPAGKARQRSSIAKEIW